MNIFSIVECLSSKLWTWTTSKLNLAVVVKICHTAHLQRNWYAMALRLVGCLDGPLNRGGQSLVLVY